MLNVDLAKMYEAQQLIKDPDNDLDVLEILADNIEGIEEQAELGNSKYARYQYVKDDTTHVYVDSLIAIATDIVRVFGPLCEDFLGLTDKDRKEGLKLLAEYNLAYAVINYRARDYYIIAEEIASGKTDLSEVTLPRELLNEVTANYDKVVKTLQLIQTIFKESKVFFAEYQITDQELLNDIQSYLESNSGSAIASDSAIAELSVKDVERILKNLD